MGRTNSFIPDAALPLSLWAQMARLTFESQMVIGMRMAGMMGLSAHAPGENMRMVTEKMDAARESMQASFRSVSRGDSVEKTLSAALQPYAKRTRANTKRLSKRR